MKCPFCNEENTRVIDSRPAEDNNSIRRRRQCESCERRFTTYEKVETIPLVVIKKDKNRESFSRNKLMAGVVRSCHKRPVAIQDIEVLVDDIENNIYNTMKKEIESKEIGEMVMEHLRSIDEVAYVRFASVYREFRDVNTFMDELKKILNEKK